MVRELASMEHTRAFLGSSFANPSRGDSSLISQCELWSISARVFDAFGADIERTSPSYVNSIDNFNSLYDDWFNEWRPVLSPMGHLLRGRHQITIPSSQTSDHVLGIYYSAAKLQLFSHIFRGPAQRIPHPPIAVSDRNNLSKFLSQAVHSAVDQLDKLTSMLTSGSSFEILPAYLATAIAYSSVLLSKILTAQSYTLVSEDDEDICNKTMEQLCETSRVSGDGKIADISDGSTPRILLSKIVNTLKSVIGRSRGEAPHPNASMIVGSSAVRPQESYISPHASHELFDIGSFNVFDVDMPLDFDFNLIDGNSFEWDESGGQVT